MDKQTDLVRRVLRGDRTSFQDIIAWYSRDVLRLCELLLRDPEEAKDVLQESMLRLVRVVRQNRFRVQNGSIKGFLLTTARNCCIDRLKKRVDFRSIDDDEIIDSIASTWETPDRVADEKRFEAAFRDALEQLSDAQRTVLVLHEVDGQSPKEIANTLNCSAECARSHLYLARRKMRLLLERFIGEL